MSTPNKKKVLFDVDRFRRSHLFRKKLIAPTEVGPTSPAFPKK